MIHMEEMKKEYLPQYSQIYVDAYQNEPWNEHNDLLKIENYFLKFMQSESRFCYVLFDSDEMVGIALCVLIPCVDKDFVRIEDFCISSQKQRKGYGSIFINLICEKVKEIGGDSILLGTQKNFPSHKFYLKNNFQEIDTSILLYREV